MRRLLFALLGLVALAQAQLVDTSNGVNEYGPAEVMDTRRFFPQINTTIIRKPARRENQSSPIRIKENPLLAPTSVVTGDTGNYSHRHLVAKFPGISFTNTWPPDTHLAVGPNHVVMCVNTDIAFFDKATGAKTFQQTYNDFFNRSGLLYDPKVIYDRLANRWFTIILSLNLLPGTQASEILYAISDDNDPNGTWFKYTIDVKATIGGNPTFIDYPGLGYNKDAYMVTGDQFKFSNQTFAGVQWVVIRKAPILNGASQSVFKLPLDGGDPNLSGPNIQVAEMFDANINRIYTVATARDFQSPNAIQVYTASNLTAVTPTFSQQLVSVPAFDKITTSARSTNGRTLETLGGRVFNAYFRNNKLYTTFTHGSANPVKVRWYEFNVNTTSNVITLGQTGDITSGTDDTHMASIAANGAGRVGMVFNRSNSNITADLMFTSRIPTDPAGTMATPTLLISSSGNDWRQGRWGDYSATCIDPTDDTAFWVAGMVIDSATSGTFGNLWKTHFFKVSFGPTLASLTTNLDIVESRSELAATVTLSENAPAGGRIVNLSSSNAAAIVPDSVTVAAGESTAGFSITADLVTSSTAVTITAAMDALSRTKAITVIPPARPSLFEITPAEVTGGSSATGTITLDRPAQAGGASVTITETAAELTTPARIRVSEAATTGTFTITTSAVTASVTRTVEVSRLGQTRSDTLTLNPAMTITGFAIDRGQITARTPVLGTVTFSTGAPAGYSISGFDNSAFTSIPAVINVPEGQNKVSFTIATSPVSVNTQSTVSVRKGTQTFSRVITIVPPRLATFQISPTVVKGGGFVLGSIQLTGPAPAAGIVVNMSSNGPEAIVPATVNFPVNVGLIRQRIDTTPVTVQVIRTITVTQGTFTRTGNVTIRP